MARHQVQDTSFRHLQKLFPPKSDAPAKSRSGSLPNINSLNNGATGVYLTFREAATTNIGDCLRGGSAERRALAKEEPDKYARAVVLGVTNPFFIK